MFGGMASSKHDGIYKYKGFYLLNDTQGEWNVEPLQWSVEELEERRGELDTFRTLKLAKEWISKEGQELLK